MVAELPGSGTLAAMMLLIGMTMAALVLCAARALWTLWTQEERTENVQGINHLPDLTIAPKRGRKYHRTTCPHTRANSDSKEFSACSLCFPEKYMYKETVVRKESCRFTAAVVTLLCGAILGSLATFCGMMMIPGTGEQQLASTTRSSSTRRRPRKTLPLGK